MSEDHKKDEHAGHSKGGGHGHGGGHGGGGHEEGHEGAPEWLISFADNVMLQMGFFVILLALNMGPKATTAAGGQPSDTPSQHPSSNEIYDFIISVREGFNNPVDMMSTDPKDAPLIRRLKERNGGPATQNAPEGDKAAVQDIRPGDYTSIGGKILFEDGADLIGELGKTNIAAIAEKIRDSRWVVEVRGHVSPAEALRDFGRGMDLSHRRALAVAESLRGHGVKPEQLRIVACGDGDRIVARTYDRDQDRSNQRVEVVQTTKTLPPDPYSKEGAK